MFLFHHHCCGTMVSKNEDIVKTVMATGICPGCDMSLIAKCSMQLFGKKIPNKDIRDFNNQSFIKNYNNYIEIDTNKIKKIDIDTNMCEFCNEIFLEKDTKISILTNVTLCSNCYNDEFISSRMDSIEFAIDDMKEQKEKEEEEFKLFKKLQKKYTKGKK